MNTIRLDSAALDDRQNRAAAPTVHAIKLRAEAVAEFRAVLNAQNLFASGLPQKEDNIK
jgi:hypothetical protein